MDGLHSRIRLGSDRMRVHTSRTEFGTSKHQLIVHVSYRPVTCVKGQQPLLQRSHGFGRCSCSAAAPSAPLHPTRKVNKHVPGQQAFTDVDIATRSMQQSRWDKMYGVVLTPPARDGSLPQVCNGSGIVMVEGLNDARAVRQGVNAPVLIIGGTNSAKNKGGFRRMQDIHEAVPKIVVLADPDAEGTRFRNWVVQKLGDEKLLHAFLPLSRAVLTSSTKYHSLGNPGIEHAHARDVAKAVSLATERVPGRIEFCREDLEDWEMVNSWDEAGVKHAALRREILCNALGVGKMDGGKLLKVLNVYNFNRDEVCASATQFVSSLCQSFLEEVLNLMPYLYPSTLQRVAVTAGLESGRVLTQEDSESGSDS